MPPTRVVAAVVILAALVFAPLAHADLIEIENKLVTENKKRLVWELTLGLEEGLGADIGTFTPSREEGDAAEWDISFFFNASLLPAIQAQVNGQHIVRADDADVGAGDPFMLGPVLVPSLHLPGDGPLPLVPKVRVDHHATPRTHRDVSNLFLVESDLLERRWSFEIHAFHVPEPSLLSLIGGGSVAWSATVWYRQRRRVPAVRGR